MILGFLYFEYNFCTMITRQKHQCSRANCQGHSKDYENYLNDPNTTKPKLKSAKTARSCYSLHAKMHQPKLKPSSKPSK